MSEKEKDTYVLSFELCYNDKANRDAAAKVVGDTAKTYYSTSEEKKYTLNDCVEIEAEGIYDVFNWIYRYITLLNVDKSAHVWYFCPDYQNVCGIARTTQIEYIDHKPGEVMHFHFSQDFTEPNDHNIAKYTFTITDRENQKTEFEFIDGGFYENEIAELLWRMISHEYHDNDFTEEEMDLFVKSFPDEFGSHYFAG